MEELNLKSYFCRHDRSLASVHLFPLQAGKINGLERLGIPWSGIKAFSDNEYYFWPIEVILTSAPR